jgi:hypothetical protein
MEVAGSGSDGGSGWCLVPAREWSSTERTPLGTCAQLVGSANFSQ